MMAIIAHLDVNVNVKNERFTYPRRIQPAPKANPTMKDPIAPAMIAAHHSG
jgi:hypothetical protein